MEAAEGEALAFHFRRIEDALAFLSAFPKLELADDTAMPSPSAPQVQRGGRSGG